MREWTITIGVSEAEIRGWPDGPVIIARARQGHPDVTYEMWGFIEDALNAAEEWKDPANRRAIQSARHLLQQASNTR